MGEELAGLLLELRAVHSQHGQRPGQIKLKVRGSLQHVAEHVLTYVHVSIHGSTGATMFLKVYANICQRIEACVSILELAP